MITIDELGKSYSPIEIPTYDGLLNPRIKYEREIDRINETRLLVALTVTIELHEVLGSRVFKAFFCTYRYQVNITKILTVNDLFDIWAKSEKDLVKKYNKFEKSKGWRETPISLANRQDHMEEMDKIVEWFYSLPN
jgi:hypothetical protein